MDTGTSTGTSTGTGAGTGTSTGTGSATGAGTVPAVVRLVRERLGESESGRAALTGLGVSPRDPAAADRLGTALREAVGSDPEFGRRLATLLTAPPPPAEPPGRPPNPSGTATGDPAGELSLGPLTISTTRGGAGALLATVACVLGIVVLAVYGGAKALDGDEAAGGSGRGGGTAARPGGPDGRFDGRDRSVLKDRDVVASILPGLDAVPGGWTVESAPEVAQGTECPPVATRMSACGTVSYLAPETDNVASFHVIGFPDVTAARQFYREMKETKPPSVALPALGDESHAYEQDGEAPKEVHSVVRSGTVVVGVIYEIEAESWTETYGADHLEILTGTLTERLRQAVSGQTPTTRVVF
ncbi:hypothetical protein ABZ714_15125 [Streptomyces sp. NPDC006798]|uniref:hypothetical protein n=1 Tax=Streptomyces sp. NPDC006798 TaxID=3155462 RepID=UPI0033F5ABF3